MKANKEIFRYSFPIIIAVILTAISNHADQLILSQLIPYKEFAFYTIGCLIIHPLQILESSVNRVLIPQLANLVSNDKIQEGAFLFKKAISDIAFIIIPATAGLMIFSTPIIVLLFTDKFLPSVMYLQLFALTYLFYINPADALPRASGLGTWILKVKIVSATLSVITVPVMIKLFGPVGALYSLLFLGACYHGYCLWFTKKLSKWRVPEFIPFKMLLTIFISTLIPSILSFIVKPLFNSEMAWFLTCGPIFAVMYFSVMLPIKNSIERRYTWNCNVMSLTKVFSIGGLERMIANLTISVKKLNNFNPSIYIFDHLPNYPNLISELEKSNIPYALSTKPPGFGFKVLFNICKYLYKNNIHIIHTHDLSALIYGTLAKVFTLNKVKVIHTQHSFVHLKAKKSYRTMEKIFTKLADEIVVVSEDLKKTYGEIGVPNKKIHVFENGISFSDTLECFPKERYKNRYSFIDNCTDLHSKKFLKNHEHDIWLIALSRISPGKGQEHMISVWNELDSDIRKKTFFIIVGPLDSSNSEWLSNFHDTLKRAKDRDRILLYGPTNSPATWMKMANVFTSGSEFEGMPLGPIEAACEGCALFLSDIVGHSFFEQKAVHFSLSDFKEAGSKLTQLIETINMNQEIFYERKLLLAKQMRAKYDMDEVAYKYAKLYKKHSSKRLII